MFLFGNFADIGPNQVMKPSMSGDGGGGSEIERRGSEIKLPKEIQQERSKMRTQINEIQTILDSSLSRSTMMKLRKKINELRALILETDAVPGTIKNRWTVQIEGIEEKMGHVKSISSTADFASIKADMNTLKAGVENQANWNQTLRSAPKQQPKTNAQPFKTDITVRLGGMAFVTDPTFNEANAILGKKNASDVDRLRAYYYLANYYTEVGGDKKMAMADKATDPATKKTLMINAKRDYIAARENWNNIENLLSNVGRFSTLNSYSTHNTQDVLRRAKDAMPELDGKVQKINKMLPIETGLDKKLVPSRRDTHANNGTAKQNNVRAPGLAQDELTGMEAVCKIYNDYFVRNMKNPAHIDAKRIQQAENSIYVYLENLDVIKKGVEPRAEIKHAALELAVMAAFIGEGNTYKMLQSMNVMKDANNGNKTELACLMDGTKTLSQILENHPVLFDKAKFYDAGRKLLFISNAQRAAYKRVVIHALDAFNGLAPVVKTKIGGTDKPAPGSVRTAQTTNAEDYFTQNELAKLSVDDKDVLDEINKLPTEDKEQVMAAINKRVTPNLTPEEMMNVIRDEYNKYKNKKAQEPPPVKLPADDNKILTPTTGAGTDTKKKKGIGYGVDLNVRSDWPGSTGNVKFNMPAGVLTTPLKNLFNDIFKGAASATVTGGKQPLKLTDMGYGDMKRLVEYIEKNPNRTCKVRLDNEKTYDLAYSNVKDANGVNHFAIELRPPEGALPARPSQPSTEFIVKPLITIRGEYSSTPGHGITLNKASIEARAANAELSGFWNYQFSNGHVTDGNFGVNLQLGTGAHLVLNGVGFDYMTDKIGKIALKDNLLESTIVINNKTYTLSQIITDDKARGEIWKVADESFNKGYLSLDMGYDRLSLKIDKLDVKGMAADNIRIAAGDASANFRNSEFRLEFTGKQKEGVDAGWWANGEKMFSFHMPPSAPGTRRIGQDAPATALAAAIDAFEQTIADQLGPNAKGKNVMKTLQDASSAFLTKVAADDNIRRNTTLDVNLAGLMRAFDGGNFTGDFANGLGMALRNLPGNGNVTLSVADMETLTTAMTSPTYTETGRWLAAENFLRNKLNLPSGQQTVENAVMSLYLLQEGASDQIVKRALSENNPVIQAFAQDMSEGTARMRQQGVGAAFSLMNKEDFALYFQAAAALEQIDSSVFGNSAEQSNLNYVAKSFTIDAKVGERWNSINLELGAGGAISIPLEGLLEAKDSNGTSFAIPVQGEDRAGAPQYRAYVFGRYAPFGEKLRITVIGGWTPEYLGKGNISTKNPRFRVGATVVSTKPFEIKVIKGVTASPDISVSVPNFSDPVAYVKPGINFNLPGIGIANKFALRVGAEGMSAKGITPTWAPTASIGANLRVIKDVNTEISGSITLPDGKKAVIGLGTKWTW